MSAKTYKIELTPDGEPVKLDETESIVFELILSNNIRLKSKLFLLRQYREVIRPEVWQHLKEMAEFIQMLQGYFSNKYGGKI